MFGESASIIHETVFQYMTLGQVKGKLRRENLERPHKVTAALRNKVKLGESTIEIHYADDRSSITKQHAWPQPGRGTSRA